MTDPKIIYAIREKLTTPERGQLAAELIADLGQSKLLGPRPTTPIRGSDDWSAEELRVFHMVISIVLDRLETTPPDFAEKVVAHLRALAEKFPQRGD